MFLHNQSLLRTNFFLSARSNFDHLNREELLFELDMALQHNQDLNDRLRRKYSS